MHYLFDRWNELKKDLKTKSLFIFLDYDGTLTPIKKTPREAKISAEAKKVLKRLAKKGRSKIAIISGRSLGDIKKIIGIRDILYVGNHGLEIEGPKIRFRCPVPDAYMGTLRKIKRELAAGLSKIEGVIIEDKGLTLSVHFRQVKKKDELPVNTIFHNSVRPYIEKRAVRVTSGKKVFEVRPPLRWDKGKAVMWLLARSHYNVEGAVMPVYVGDDVTDEDAFKALRKRGITVFVGNNLLSKAKYYLDDSREVIKFLKMIASLEDKKI
ncbi:MAG: trehalose-phosphatase [Candidatus Omnitrophica bacterium]|nr:trehalose-phosphatase [Candidatus Omnitrophota bacterium]MBU4487809.1 trehalose-phosphatase [Candidatus Omnitrophota bacterium]MCG2705551.1 trehalose-phosphatase [Candidatus Omnitrophota bacterium]